MSKIEQDIKQKIETFGTPLKEWNISINYGIKTGFNEAFIIDEAKKNELIALDPKSAEIIRPILRGRDIKRYFSDWQNLYLICTFPSLKINIDEYPAIKKHLLYFGKERLEQTGQTHVINGERIKSRKKTTNKWFETQDSINYWDDFNKQKIIYSETNNANETKIVFDEEGYFTDKTCFIITSASVNIKNLYQILSSIVFTWYMKNKSPLLGATGISLTKELVETFPCVYSVEESIYDSYNLTEEEVMFIKNSLNIS